VARIGFLPLPETGHLLESLKLARDLEARGHRVQYFSIPDLEDGIRAQGMAFVPILAEQLPKGFLARMAVMAAQGSRFAILGQIRRMIALGQTIADLAVARGSRVLFEDAPPDFVIVDALMAPAALLCYGSGIPAALLHGLPTGRDPSVPPVTSPLIPAATLRSRVAIAWAWRWLFLRQFVLRKLTLDDVKLTRRLAAAAGFPLRDIETATSFMCATPRVPEILLCPRRFDFPRPDAPQRHYAGPTIDFDRTEPDFEWRRLAPDRPLVYCSLGSQGHLSASTRRILRAAIDAIAGRPDWQGVVAVGPHLPIEDFRSPRDNVVVVSFAPQLQILRRASLMITHGGLATVRECIYHGVPMVVFPLVRDQPGNAARVVYHGLGAMGDPRRVTAESLGRLVEAVGRAPSVRANVDAMAREFQRAEAEDRAVDVVEELLATSRR
jgi:UDP:flavonoid glycosyltransferase YjiC (YdhE family)